MSSKKGITLVALVITIVVLLILAGVSITAISGNNGVVTKAADAKKETEEAEAREELEQVIGAAQADFSQLWMNNTSLSFFNVLGTTTATDKIDLTKYSSTYNITYDSTNKTGTITKKKPDNSTSYSFELEEIGNMGAGIKKFNGK